MPRKSKRAHEEVIDLTGDDPVETHRSKRAALGNAQSSQLNAKAAAPHLTSSQNYSSSQAIPVIEPDAIDLTQDDDGPVRELYGSFGGSSSSTRI